MARTLRHWKGTTGMDRLVVNQLNIAGRELSLGRPGQTYYVDAYDGNDSYNGKTWDRPFLTMERAFETLSSGDTISVVGKIREQLITPVQVFDVTIIGGGNRPRHADAEPDPTGRHTTATWAPPDSPTAATPLVKVLQQGWRFQNLVFVGPTDAASVLLFRDGGSGNAERDASHAEFIGCRFASGATAIEQSGGAGHMGLYNCFITSMTAAALKHTGGAGIGYPIRMEAIGNRFASCPTIMTAVAAFDYSFQDNTFMFESAPTLVFDFTGGARNNMGGRQPNSYNIAAEDFDPLGGVTGSGATDVWRSILTNAEEIGLPAN